ncbi:MAG: FAD binding domain-containing protein [Actinomycetota bacterium]|nr:FAD binding domain-containing protein [Actinomycetota bacterium]
MKAVEVHVNGRALAMGDIPAHVSALDWLRAQGLTGAKDGCAEGECGACTVLVARPGSERPTEWTPVNACLVPMAGLAGQEVVTSEGLGSPETMHPVQSELAIRGGSQCGYCTPGFVCSMAAEYYRPGRGQEDDEGFDIHALSGNLCRCTGYRPIKDAALALGPPSPGDPLAARCDRPAPDPVPTRTRDFVRPATLAEALRTRSEGAQVVAGSTDWGVEVNLRGARVPLTVAVDHLPELRELTIDDDHASIGAALSLTEVERRLDGTIPLLEEVFPLFASRLIRNSATFGGNLATASPIGDLPPALLALDATLVLVSPAGEREVPVSDFFTGYRATQLEPDELIRSVRVPLPLAWLTAFHKIAKRLYDDISSVAVAFALDVDAGVVRRARIGLGGVAATPIRALATEAALVDRPWSQETVARAASVLAEEGTPMDDHRASAAYRSAMLGNALRKLWVETATPEPVR